MGILDIKTDGVVAASSSATNAASIEADLRTRKNLLERILSVVGDVRSGEGLGALILTINLFTLLGYSNGTGATDRRRECDEAMGVCSQHSSGRSSHARRQLLWSDAG